MDKVYFKGISNRIHNLQSMLGVFNKEKQIGYVEEVKKCILPAIKEAGRNFPKQKLACENIKLMMKLQIKLIKHIWN